MGGMEAGRGMRTEQAENGKYKTEWHGEPLLDHWHTSVSQLPSSTFPSSPLL